MSGMGIPRSAQTCSKRRVGVKKSPTALSMACVCAKSFQSCLTLATQWTVAHQASLSMGFSRQEDWSGLSFPSPGDLPDPGIKPRSHFSCTGRQVLLAPPEKPLLLALEIIFNGTLSPTFLT